MEFTTIQFPSMQKLWEFQKKAQLRAYHFETSSITLRALLTEDQLGMALSHFHAQVKDRQETA